MLKFFLGMLCGFLLHSCINVTKVYRNIRTELSVPRKIEIQVPTLPPPPVIKKIPNNEPAKKT